MKPPCRGRSSLDRRAQPRAFLGALDSPRHSDVVAGRHVHQMASGQRDRGGQPRALGAHRLLGDLNDDLLIAMQLLLDRKAAALLVHTRAPFVRFAAAPPAAAAAFGGRRRGFARSGGRRSSLVLALRARGRLHRPFRRLRFVRFPARLSVLRAEPLARLALAPSAARSAARLVAEFAARPAARVANRLAARSAARAPARQIVPARPTPASLVRLDLAGLARIPPLRHRRRQPDQSRRRPRRSPPRSNQPPATPS